MKKTFTQRAISLLLAALMVVGMIPSLMTVDAAAAGTGFATPATKDEIADVARWFAANNGANSTGTYAKIIDGAVYTWGSNVRLATGLMTFTDSSGTVVNVVEGTKVTVPTQIPQEGFQGEKAVRVTASVSVFAVLTDQGNVFTWGHSAKGTNVPGTRQYKVNVDAVTALNRKIVDFRSIGIQLFLKDSAGEWWTVGGASSACALLGGAANSNTTAQKIPPAIIEQCGGGILDINGQWNYNTVVLGTNGQLYGFGGTLGNANVTGVGYKTWPMNADGTQSNGSTIPIKYNGLVTEWNNLKFTQLSGEDWSVAAVDENGNVWGWGAQNYNHLGANCGTELGIGNKIFNADLEGKQAVRVQISSYVTAILCSDNTVYALGNNANKMIDPDKGNGIGIGTPTQVYKELSETATIVGVFPSNSSMVAITKASDMFFLGDNSTGAAGTGSTENSEPGESTIVSSPNMPPSEPLTANELIFELEVDEGTSIGYYRYKEDGSVVKKNGADWVASTAPTLSAGKIFKLNVYFNDFGKVNDFVVPIRFDPEAVQVVNGSGVAYTTAQVVTPGVFSESAGIEQHFDTDQWKGGQLALSTNNGRYPKISNGAGYVSVAGLSSHDTPMISGEVKMFSISFMSQVTKNNLKFEFATPDNNIAILDGYAGDTYDSSLNELGEGLAYWGVYNKTNAADGTSTSGYFEFKNAHPVSYHALYVKVDTLAMELVYGPTDSKINDQLADDADIYKDLKLGWNINYSNKDVVYKMKSIAGSYESGKTPSFPQVSWTVEVWNTQANPNHSTPTTSVNETNYINVIGMYDEYMTFTVSDTLMMDDETDPGVIKFTATTTDEKSAKVSVSYYVVLRSYNPPKILALAQKDSTGSLVQLTDGQTLTYHYTNNNKVVEDRMVYVDFDGATQNTEVVWELFDSQYNLLAMGDANNNPVTVSTTYIAANPATNTDVEASATITPIKSNDQDDYVILRVSSLYDSTKYDEVKIYIQLYATDIQFSSDPLYMPVSSSTMTSSLNLKNFLQVKPADVYVTNFTWRIAATPENAPPDNADGATGPYNWGSLGSGNSASVFYAGDWATPTPAGNSNNITEYVTIEVTETYSNTVKTVDIAILDLDCPINMGDITATNNIGYNRDTVSIAAGLQRGDKISFYYDYNDGLDTDNLYKTFEVVDGMWPSFDFIVGTVANGLMEGEGGYLGMVLTRPDDSDAKETSYAMVPVSYGPEPTLIYGYVQLHGKETNSIYNKDITVRLEGFEVNETVYTNAEGRFQFSKYIAPGTYSLTIKKANYLARYIAEVEIQVDSDTGEFCIAKQTNPILLFPGDFDNSDKITQSDINFYVQNWLGLVDDNVADYDLYDIMEDGKLSMKDLEMVMVRKDWQPTDYPNWYTPKQ